VPIKATEYSVFNAPFTIDDANGYLNASYETDLGLYLYSASRFYFGHYAHEGQRVIDDPTPMPGANIGRNGGAWTRNSSASGSPVIPSCSAWNTATISAST
jgi:hypothetical protein